MSEKDSYQKLIEHHKKWIFGAPGPELLRKLLEMRFTPQEAELLSKIPFIPYKAKYLSKKLSIPVEELTEKLDRFARRGLVFRYEQGKIVRYALGDLILIFFRNPWWPGVDEEWMYELAPLVNKYYEEEFGPEIMGNSTIIQRAVPINQTIKDNRSIMPYDDIVKLIDQYEYFGVSHCGCRRRHNLDPEHYEKSKYPTECCMHFNELARFAVQNELAREITKEEAVKILKKCADAGMVHGYDNAMNGASTLCNCSPDYCLWLDSMVKMPAPVPRGLQKSNYIRDINKEKCKKCGICAKVCPMDAIEFKKDDKELIFYSEKCIGCGVCVHKCPQEAIYLVHREGEVNIPESGMEFIKRWLGERERDLAKFFQENSL